MHLLRLICAGCRPHADELRQTLATAAERTDEGPQPNPRPPAQPVAGEGAGDSTGAPADADGPADEDGRHGEYDAEMRAALLNRVSGSSFALHSLCV